MPLFLKLMAYITYTTCLFLILFFNLPFVFAINILLYILCLKLKVSVKTDLCVSITLNSIIYVYALLFISDSSEKTSVLVQTGYKNMNSVLPKII